MKDELDRFFTKHEVAKECVDLIKHLPYDWVEPSCGSGVFSSLLDCTAYDISPSTPFAFQADWLKATEEVAPSNKWGVFGNPPFGKNNKLSIAFIKQAVILGASCVAFVLPDVFHKETMQRRAFPEGWRLSVVKRLPKDSFLLFGKDYHVPCSFFVIEKGEGECLKTPKRTLDSDKIRFDNDGEWFLFGAAPNKVIPRDQVNRNNRGYYFNATKETVEQIMRINFKEHALATASGGVAWRTREEILTIYEDHYND